MAQTTLMGDSPKKERTTADFLAEKQQSISISEFFTKNRHLLGFDNPRKALLTAVKEAVDNALDAVEEMKVLPEIKVFVEETTPDRFKVTVEDNGPGIVKAQIPNIFAKLLYGSKFHRLSQSRGQQGIGISAAVLYGQLTTGKPTKIISKIGPIQKAHYYELHLNTKNNEPEIIKYEERDWEGKDHGTKVQIELEGKYQEGRLSIEEFLQLTAISNPHAQIIFKRPNNEVTEYPRVSEELPKEPKEIKPHPYGIELGILMKMLGDTKSHGLAAFLQDDFSRVSSAVAKEICDKAGLNAHSKPKSLSRDDVEKIFHAIKEVKIMAPQTDCLSPIGEERMLKGLKKEINAEFYTAVTRPPFVYRGNPFQVECCTGDTKLILEDGSLIDIKSYVEGNNNKNVFAMMPDLKIKPVKVAMKHKFENKHKILNIKTRSGREIQVTNNNEIPIIENGEIIWKTAEELMAGDCVACPREYNIEGIKPKIFDLLDEEKIQVVDKEIILEVIEELRKKLGSLKEVSRQLNINYEFFKAMNRKILFSTKPNLSLFKKMINLAELDQNIIKNIKEIRLVDNQFRNPMKIKNAIIDEDVLYVLGLICSDGYLSKQGIQFVNNDNNLHYLFSSIIKNKFNINVAKYGKNSTFCNKTIYEIFLKLKMKISQLSNNLLVAWMKGIVDGDGWVCLKDERISIIGIATAKKKEAFLVQTILLRLNILSKIEKQNISKKLGTINGREIKTKFPKYNIIISNSENIKKFAELISFRQLERSHKLSKGIIYDLKNRRDSIPLGNLLNQFRNENELYQYQVGLSGQNVKEIEKSRINISRENLQLMIQSEKYCGQAFEKLKILANSDLIWDKIIDIEFVENQEWVYDLTTEVGNFVANNIIMHNCALAFGGDLPKEELVRVIRYANKVPLQHQAGACALTKSVTQTAWKNYGVSQSKGALPIGPIVIMVHIASVWVPFTSESKEAVASYEEIMKEVKLVVQEVGRKLALYVRKNIKSKEQQERVNLFEKYIPELAVALFEITGVKKEKIQEELDKILKKELKGMLEEVNKHKDVEIDETNVVYGNKQEGIENG